MGYFPWIVAGTLLDSADRNPNGKSDVILLPIAAAFVMTQWDLVMDPPSSTISKAWIWHDGGTYFGVPHVNYFGWLLTSWLFYQAFALYLSRRRDVSEQPKGSIRAIPTCRHPVLHVRRAGTHDAIPAATDGEITDAAGRLWGVHDLRATTVLIKLFTMALTSILAALRLARDDSRS
jgi:Carotenoid biosynthesis protein